MNLFQFARFLVVGAINTLVGFTIYTCLVLAGVAPLPALVLSNAAGVAFNFFSIGGYVFRSRVLARFPRFVACYLFTLGVNMALLHWLLRWVTNPIAAQALVTAPMAVFSYLLMSNLVFNAKAEER